ncbi:MULTISPECIES: arsenate reductase/protein-tyrosine-phosphatase family protein [Micromonospora]|uniref:protein-tyrosine-phosphatase n=1 Tax=Micromonospora yangpuensis TaxID=683228 RepID=A0A1C6V6Z8_9ACTN|nr:phosphotyrosine protein phosphatase [Micromonospora yangpuensis]GGM19530.1 hypothetical protein GCM10012279_42400 [Micromonospora yangpuensis]SCL62119.1 protein-tyrosine phosphatase [Micromonospora yangpuensis]
MPPFTVLHVCMGNICRSPMAERLLARSVRERLTRLGLDPQRADELVHSHSAGTGGWHAGEEMNPPAARQVVSRGGDVEGFAARKLRSDQIDAADLVLTATGDQQDYVVALRPDAQARTFVLGEFGRLLATAELAGPPPTEVTGDSVYARGVALVEAVHRARQGAAALPTDDLDDPWGRGDQCFQRIGDEIEETVRPLAALLLP